MSEYTPTIGLEIHAELRTKTKMFCSSRNDPDAASPNVNICPVCMAHPGTLPVINGEAVRQVLRVGTALGATLADYTEFDRKNYFYPDLPKGYQLSQYEYPLVSGGQLHGVEITRVHLEEDTASSIHDEKGATLVDYNRAGVPLMELVTEPVITSAEQAGEFARELQLLLRYLGASDANMEKGEMRVEANVSVGRDGIRGTKVEIKNLNSFRAMERAVAYEIARQTELLERGETVLQETRGWDEGRQTTFAQRVKEGSADYRYFPDPDLPSLKLSELEGYDHASLSATLPELPWQRRERYRAMGINPEDAELYVRDLRFGALFEGVSEHLDEAARTTASNYIANDLVKIVRDIETRDTNSLKDLPVTPAQILGLVELITGKKVSSRAAKDLLALMAAEGGDAQTIAESRGLLQTSDGGALDATVAHILQQHPGVVADYRAGKAAALEFLLGQCMKALRGAADPAVLRDLLRKNLE